MRAGVGAVLTQHVTDPRLGPLALDLLARDAGAPAAMQAILSGTPQRDWRQLTIVDAAGRTACFFGRKVLAAKAEVEGLDCAAIANIVRATEVPRAMTAAFEQTYDMPIAPGLIGALRAGEAAGGELRPITSAALIVVHTEAFADVDLRVDDHRAPVSELLRLWSIYQPQADACVVRALAPERARLLMQGRRTGKPLRKKSGRGHPCGNRPLIDDAEAQLRSTRPSPFKG